MFYLHVYMHTSYIQYLRRLEEGVRHPGTWIPGDCKLSGMCLELNLGPLQEWPQRF